MKDPVHAAADPEAPFRLPGGTAPTGGQGHWELSRKETRDLVAEAGLSVRREVPLAVLPFTERRMPRSVGLVERPEVFPVRIGWFSALPDNLIQLCGHADTGPRQALK